MSTRWYTHTSCEAEPGRRKPTVAYIAPSQYCWDARPVVKNNYRRRHHPYPAPVVSAELGPALCMDIGNYKKRSRHPWPYLVSRSHDLWLDAGVPGGAIRAEICDGINVSLAAAIVRGVVGVTTVNRSRRPTSWAGRGSTDRQDVLRDAGAAHGTRPVRTGFEVAVVASGK